jgi:hypothetical protein
MDCQVFHKCFIWAAGTNVQEVIGDDIKNGATAGT